jgi:two-component system LytT family response regulator
VQHISKNQQPPKQMKGVLIEDNYEVVKLLTQFVSEYKGDFELQGFASDIHDGKALIEKIKPDVLILDIRLGETYVFELLESVNPAYLQNTTLLFISAYFEADYLHEALKFAAVDYLLKPISKKEFFASLDKALAKHREKNVVSVIDTLKNELDKLKRATYGFRMMVVKPDGNIRKVDHKKVMYMVLRDKLVHITTPEETIPSQRSLKTYDHLLQNLPNFLRASKTTLINLDFIRSLDRAERIITMKNGAKLKCSRRKFGDLIKLINV